MTELADKFDQMAEVVIKIKKSWRTLADNETEQIGHTTERHSGAVEHHGRRFTLHNLEQGCSMVFSLIPAAFSRCAPPLN